MKRIFFLIIFSYSLLFGLSLEQAKDMALKNNLSLKAAEYDLLIAKKEYSAVLGGAFPQINLLGGVSYKKSEFPDFDDTSMNEFAKNVQSFAEPDKSISEVLLGIAQGNKPQEKQVSLSIGIEATQILSLKVPLAVRVASYFSLLNQKKYSLKKQEVLHKVIQSYYSLILAKQRLDIQKVALHLAQEHYMQAKDMFENGILSQYEQLRAALEVSKLKPTLQESEKNLLLARDNFKNLIGFDEEEILRTSDSLSIPTIEISSIERAISKGLSMREEVIISEINQKMYRTLFKIEKSSYLPDFVVKANYSKYSLSYQDKFETDNFGSYWEISSGFSIPIFTSFANKSKTKSAKYGWRRSQKNSLNTKNLIESDIKNSFYRLKQAQKSYFLYKENLILAQKAYSIAKSSFENSISTQIEFLDASLQQNIAKLSYLGAIYEYIIANEKFKLSTGEKL